MYYCYFNVVYDDGIKNGTVYYTVVTTVLVMRLGSYCYVLVLFITHLLYYTKLRIRRKLENSDIYYLCTWLVSSTSTG